MDALLTTLNHIIKEAGRAVMEYHARENCVWYKGSGNAPVTEADLHSQEILLHGLASFGYAVLSEERAPDAARLDSARVWIIDPLDGTKDFLQKRDEFSVMVGLVESGRPILGAVYQPAVDILYYARAEQGAYRQQGQEAPRRMRVSSHADFRDVRMLISRNHLLKTEGDVAERLHITHMTACGSAGVKIGLIANGQADLFINTSDRTGEWDTAAPDCIIHEAGGIMTDMHGRLLRYNKKNPKNLDGFVVSNGAMHDRVVSELARHLSFV